MKRVMTVTGEIAADALGVTMPHEHVFADISRHSGNPDNLLNDTQLCIRELVPYKMAGGSTLVDATTEDLGRNPIALRFISEAAGVNIITTTGYYSERIYPPYVLEATAAELAGRMIDEARNGIGDTGIRPGIIGELGSASGSVTTAEEKVLRAAACAQAETSLAITLHSSYGRPGIRQLAVLKDAGASPEKVIVGHVDAEWHVDIREDMEYYERILDGGACVEFDTIGWQDFCPEDERLRRILRLLEKGYAPQILLSSDLCRRSFYRANGGRGYDYVLTCFIPLLLRSGVSQGVINTLLVENPLRVLSY